ncbi:ParB N-terminal domain-containing protein [Stieleria sp. TO1_6]|nr:ParB N-terminal domain-containing protein [Stieleria tagensis]
MNKNQKVQHESIDVSAAELPIPTLEEIIPNYPAVKSVSPSCQIMPLNSPQRIRELCQSMTAAGQINPIDLDSEGSLLNGRHRLIACSMLDIAPEFRTIDPESSLEHVLADITQREYNPAAYAWIAMQIEARVKRCYKASHPTNNGKLLGNQPLKKDFKIDIGDRQRFHINKGESIQSAAIRMAGATLSAVRRLTTVSNSDPELAQKAIRGEMTLRACERALKMPRDKSDCQPNRTQQAGGRDQKLRDPVPAVIQMYPSDERNREDASLEQGQDDIDDLSRASDSPAGDEQGENHSTVELPGGLTQYHQGDRTAILSPRRFKDGVAYWNLLLLTPAASFSKRFIDADAGSAYLKKFFGTK